MTDPVDTNELRAIARDRNDVLSAWEVDAVNAAADEVDRLRTGNEHLDGELSAVSANRDHAIEGLQRLRAVIESAPHENECMQGLRGIPCDCWKADAL